MRLERTVVQCPTQHGIMVEQDPHGGPDTDRCGH